MFSGQKTEFLSYFAKNCSKKKKSRILENFFIQINKTFRFT